MQDDIEEVTTVENENTNPTRVIRKTIHKESPEIDENPQKVFEKEKTVFRFNQAVWYILGIAETILGFRIVLKAFGANPINGFTSFIYSISEPFAHPFQGIFRTSENSIYVIEWSTLIAMAVYALLAYAIVEIFQFIKPVTKSDIKHAVT